MVDMGAKLKSLRIENNLTQSQVAKRLGIAVSAVSSYELGVRYPSYPILIKLARLYHVSTDFLLGIKYTEVLDISDMSEDDIAIIKATIAAIRLKHKE